MEVAVAGGAVGATIKVVLQNLLSFPVEEIGLLWNFNKDLQKLRNSILMIQDFLEDAEMKQVANKPVNRWLMKLEAVAFDADYIFDQLNYEFLRKKMKKKATKLVELALVPIRFRHKMVRKINNINKELKLINQEASGLGLQTRIVVAQALANEESDGLSVDPIFVGRENDVENIVKMVTTAPTEQVISVLPIVGMGGVGKTSLARKVLNDAKIISHFGEICFWVHVGLDFDPVIILKKILELLTGEHVDGSKELVLRKLRKSLRDRRYLLVLDNFWDKDRVKWEKFMNSLKGISHVKGNVIIVTTREGNAASIVKEHDVHELGVLSKDDCWSIIKAKAFGEEGTKSFGFNIAKNIPLEFETVGKNIAEKCGGLPLAAQVVGSLLRDKSIDEWVTIEKNWHSSFGGHGNIVSKILKLSFDHLSSPSLKKCFAFCSIIPRSWWVEKDELIHIWMAERLIQSDQEKDLEIVGNTMFNILLESSLLQVYGRDIYGNVTSCVMHDLVHDLASSILNSRYLDGVDQVRYISRPVIYESSPMLAKCLRALFFGGKISDIEFSNMKCLHVLILTDGETNELPNEIGKLISLRYLDISHTRIKCLPDSIGDLYHLQTLRATVEHGIPSYLEKLPDTFKFLISIRHLCIPNIKLPKEIGKLVFLQTLPYFRVGDKEGCGIMELGSLKNLKGEIEIHNLEKVCDKEEAESADLFHKPNILKLKLVWDESRDHMTNDENVLEGLQPHWNLKSLEIKGFKGRSFPLWTLRMEVRENLEDHWIRLDNLLEIQLSDCKECEEIPMLGHLPRLKYLYLRHLPNVKWIGSSFYGIEGNEVNDKEKIIVFPVLEKLELNDMVNLIAWTEIEFSSSSQTQPHELLVFSCLKSLKITNCELLMFAPSHFPCLKELYIESMESGLPLEFICGSKLTSLTKLKIHKVDGLVCLPDELFNYNRNLLELDRSECNNLMHLVPYLGGGGASLKTLVIGNCSDFMELPGDLHKLINLEELRILNCPNLKSITYPSGGHLSPQGFTSLRYLYLLFCSGLTFLPCEMLESCSLSLEEFHLSGSKSLTNLAQVMSLLQKMPRLTSLGIKDVPKVTNLAAEVSSLRSLQTLGIGAPSDCYEYDSFKALLDRIFPVLQSLRYLGLEGRKQWDALPDQLQQLTSLHKLIIEDFGIEVLPEWIENFSCLTMLCLYRCPKLRCLASKKVMSGLTKLTEFEIFNCPLLKQNVEQQVSSDSEWYKISHISNIIVDGRSISAHAQ